MMKEIFDVWPFVLPVLTGVVGWLVKRKTEKVTLESGEIENASKVLDMSERITERLENQLRKSDEVISALKDTIKLMSQEKEACKRTLTALQVDYRKLQKLYADQAKELKALRADCDKLRVILDNAKLNN